MPDKRYPAKVELTDSEGSTYYCTKDGPDEVWTCYWPTGGVTHYGSASEARAILKRVIKARERELKQENDHAQVPEQ